MARFPDQTTLTRPDGLRFASKVNGRSFAAHEHTMSCLKCGNFRPRSALEQFRFAGRMNYRCRGGCSSQPRLVRAAGVDPNE